MWPYDDWREFEYRPTEHACRECGTAMLQVIPSNMLVCETEDCSLRDQAMFLT